MKAAICVECKPAKAIAAGQLDEKHPPTHVVDNRTHTKVVIVDKEPMPREKVIAFMQRVQREWRAAK